MPGPHHAYYVRARERERRLLDTLIEAQEKGQPTPKAAALAKICGWQTTKGVHQAISRLADAGLIIKHPFCDPIVQIDLARGQQSSQRARRSVMHFLSVAARVSAIPLEDLLRPNRSKLYSRPRAIAFHFAREEGWSLSKIGRMAKRDHTSVLYACKKIDRLRETDPLFARLYKRTEAALQGEPPAPLIPFTPAPPAKCRTRFELGESGELEPVAPPKRKVDPLLGALLREHPERFAA